MSHQRRALFLFVACLLPCAPAAASLGAPLSPLDLLQRQLLAASMHAPGNVGIEIEDLATGSLSGINASRSMPAASTIKIPVMVEVFRQMADGDIDLNTPVHLQASDRDWGSGDLCEGAVGTRRSVEQLLWLMINDSDNTATNMLIRLVGRQSVNHTMAELGLHHTWLEDYIRSDDDSVRTGLRSTPAEMVRLLDGIARDQLIDPWSSREMLAILTGQTHNSLLPMSIPKGVQIAHKTGSLHDTLNDVGIVYEDNAPYVIAVMTTNLPNLPIGRRFIHKISRLAYDQLGRFATWRQREGMPGFDVSAPAAPAAQTLAPDLQMWNAGPRPPAQPDVSAPGDISSY